MIDNIYLIQLYDIYGKLLTKKQRDTFELYYLKDLSLREIAENSMISFQAVRYSLEVSKKLLLNYEDVVRMHELRKNINELYKISSNNKEILKIIEKIKGM